MRFTTIRAFRGLMLWNLALALLIMIDSFPKDPSAPRRRDFRRDTDIRHEGARLIAHSAARTGPRRAPLHGGWREPNRANSRQDPAKGRPN